MRSSLSSRTSTGHEREMLKVNLRSAYSSSAIVRHSTDVSLREVPKTPLLPTCTALVAVSSYPLSSYTSFENLKRLPSCPNCDFNHRLVCGVSNSCQW